MPRNGTAGNHSCIYFFTKSLFKKCHIRCVEHVFSRGVGVKLFPPSFDIGRGGVRGGHEITVTGFPILLLTAPTKPFSTVVLYSTVETSIIRTQTMPVVRSERNQLPKMINNLTASLFRGFLLVASLAANLSSAETSEDMLRLMLRSQLGAMGKDFVFVVPKETSDINANETAQLNCFLKLSSFSRCKHGSFRHARQRKRSVLLFDFGKLCQRGTKKCAIKELQRQWRRRKRRPATPTWKIISSPPFLRARGIYIDHLYLCAGILEGVFLEKDMCFFSVGRVSLPRLPHCEGVPSPC